CPPWRGRPSRRSSLPLVCTHGSTLKRARLRRPSGERHLQESRLGSDRRIARHRGGGAVGQAVCGRASSDNLTGSAKGSLGRPSMDEIPPLRPPSYDKKIGLVLQGGGALGSYQAGVYEAL